MSDLRKYIEKQMWNPEFQTEHEATMAELEIMRAYVAGRAEANLTHSELAKRSGVGQSDINRIEHYVSVPNTCDWNE